MNYRVSLSSPEKRPAIQKLLKRMCGVRFYQQPICRCIYISGDVTLCSLFQAVPANKNKTTTFNPKLLTAHYEGLDLFFNGTDYVSDDIKSIDVAPTGLDCPEIDLREEKCLAGPCVLCDCSGALKYLKVKGIKYKPAFSEEKGNELPSEVIVEGVAEGAGEDDAKGESVRGSEGESEARCEGGSSSEKGGDRSKPSFAREVIERRQNRATGKRLAETLIASMGWD